MNAEAIACQNPDQQYLEGQCHGCIDEAAATMPIALGTGLRQIRRMGLGVVISWTVSARAVGWKQRRLLQPASNPVRVKTACDAFI